jgi:tetratricopeptide (TPR) repeat protein
VNPDLNQLAIQASLSHNWKEAIKLNLQILKGNSQDTDALNRLGKAYLQSGFKTKAFSVYKKVLRIDKYNPIAVKNLQALKSFRVIRKKGYVPPRADFSTAFLEEPGTTKTVSLIRLGDSQIVSHLQPGDEVFLAAREHCVSAVTGNQEYIGRLPDDLASRLRGFLRAGNTYQAWIKSADSTSKPPTAKIFIREVSRARKYRNTPSFPATEKLSYAAFTPPELVHTEKPNISTPEEDYEQFTEAEEKLESESETDNSGRNREDENN